MQGDDAARPSTPGTPEPAEAEAAAPPPVQRCSWCSTAAPAGATRCPSCGAALVESQAIGESGIPGITDLDPSVVAGEQSARRQLKYATRSHMLGSVLGAAGGGLLGHVIGEALESYVAARAAGPSGDVNAMGIMDLLELERGGKSPDDDEQAAPVPSAQLADPWVDLPPPSIEDQIAGTDLDPWAVRDHSGDSRFDPWATPAESGAPGTTGTTGTTGTPVSDPWALDGGPWSQDPWGQQSGTSDPNKR